MLIKKIGISLFSMGLLFIGCSSSQGPLGMSNEVADFRCRKGGALAPEWTCNKGKIEGAIWSVGIANANIGNNEAHQQDVAYGNARDELSRKIATNVKNLLDTYSSSTSSSFDSASLRVSRQLSSNVISNSSPIDSWSHPSTKTLYVLMTLKTNIVKENVKDAIKTSFKNDKAMYQKFLLSENQGKLEEALSK